MTKPSYKSQDRLNLATKPLLLVLSGPSGSGKDAVLARMKELDSPLQYVVTVTTRPKRSNEKDNVDYHFVSRESFQKMIEHENLLEWANVYGNWYGVPKQAVKETLDVGQDTIVKVDIQGAATIRKLLPQAVFIFLMPPSMPELATRLKMRHTESAADLALRLKTAEEEVKKLLSFDYAIVNKHDGIDQVVSDILAIISAEKCRVTPREVSL
jgi:guanylate kinase